VEKVLWHCAIVSSVSLVVVKCSDFRGNFLIQGNKYIRWFKRKEVEKIFFLLWDICHLCLWWNCACC